ncbi:MAG: hypothetical protein D6806_17825, partial [Deltaproteobacteria bacterium]
MRTTPLSIIAVVLFVRVAEAHQVEFTIHEYLVYGDRVESLAQGTTLELGMWDYHDEQGNWIEVPRVVPGRISGPGSATVGPYNGLREDPGWVRIEVSGTFQQLEIRGAEDDGQNRGRPGAFSPWYTVAGNQVPTELKDMQYLELRLTLAGGDEVRTIDFVMTANIRDYHPRLLVDDLAELRARCSGALSHQCQMNSMFANSSHLTAPLDGYSESQLARIAKAMAFEYLTTGDPRYADRVREILLRLASYDRQHWADLRDSIQDLGLGWIGLSWMLALDWSFLALQAHQADLQAIADGTAVFVDYLLEMYQHSDFNNHSYLGRSPVILAGLALSGEGLRDADAARYLEKGFDLLYNHWHPALNSVAGEMGGWHESLGYFDGEMGYPLAVQMDGLRTACGIDFFQDSSFWRSIGRWYLASTVPWDKTLVHWADQGKDRWSRSLDGSVEEGKGTRQYLTAVEKNLARLGHPEAEWVQYLLDDLIGLYYDSGTYAESYYKVAHMNDVLWYQPGHPKSPLPDSPATYHFENLGEVIMRQGNSVADPMAMFACSWFRGGHQQADNGHFSIWYKGYLAVDSGYYDGWGSDHHMNYARRTIAHNTLTVTMPGETFHNTSHNDGGQKLGCNTDYYNSPAEDPDCHACSMKVSTVKDPYFDFISADLTNSYDPAKVSLVTREFVYIRPNTFVVFDRVESTDPTFQKRSLLHSNGRFTNQDSTWYTDDDQGRLWLQVLLPVSAQVVQVGGAGHEWEIDGVNYPPSRGQEFAGAWRLEITPPRQDRFTNFLLLLQASDQNVSSMQTGDTRIAQGATGVEVGNWLVWFGSQGRIDGLSYEAENTSAQHVVVGDLAPSTAYEITTGSTSVTATSDANGVLYFRDTTTGRHTVV